jgi:fumarylacetoacetase
MIELNDTHDPELTSWVTSANLPGNDFPIQNLPFAVLRRRGRKEPFRGGVAIGDFALDLGRVHAAGIFSGPAREALAAAQNAELNELMELGNPSCSALRRALSQALSSGSEWQRSLSEALIPRDELEYAVPARIGDYTDFYTSIHHATAVGRLLRPDNPLLPNYKWIPIGYHGRSSSIRVSGQRFPRPHGQILPPGQSVPSVAASKRLDYEVELGLFVGKGNGLGNPIGLADADDHIFGICLLNDWSARDLQTWEYQPLGPFLAKNFATTISPWIVTLEALAPYRVPFSRRSDEPQPLPYLDTPGNRAAGAIDIQLEASIQTQAMRSRGLAAQPLSRTSYRHAYWTAAQLVAHHTVNGCNLQAGDLLGTGTQSGPTAAEAGSLLELSAGGKQPIGLANGESRTFLEDGDALIIRAWCEKPGAARIGFGEVSGEILPATRA